MFHVEQFKKHLTLIKYKTSLYMLKIFKNPRIVFPFFMASMMAFFMSGFLTLINLGFVENFFAIWMRNFGLGFSAAFPVAYFVAPIVKKITEKICK